jgi:hypothetical protein
LADEDAKRTQAVVHLNVPLASRSLDRDGQGDIDRAVGDLSVADLGSVDDLVIRTYGLTV